MARIDLRFAEIHAPLFLMGNKGTNLGTKLDPTKRQGLKLVYDRTEKELIVTYEGMTAIVPATNVVSMLEIQPASDKMDQKAKETEKADRAAQAERATRPAVNAQVSSPQSHVHAGPGAGQTGQELAKERKK